jgi:hypothetical protein
MIKIKIPIGLLFEKLELDHNENEYNNTIGKSHFDIPEMYIETPFGHSKINLFVTKKAEIMDIELENGEKLYLSSKHIIIQNGKEVSVENAKNIDNKDGNSYKIISKKRGKTELVYDLNINSPHLYFTPDGSLHHNTKISTYAMLYDMCRVLHMKNPQEKFKLPGTTKIIFMLTNSTMETAESINYDPLLAIMRESPFFVEMFSKSDRTLFQKNIDVRISTRKRQLVGKDVIGAISDEINQEVVKGGSFELVTEMINRITSRFLLKGDTWPAHYFIISSAQTDASLTEQIRENYEGFSGIEVVNPARFDVLSEKIDYSGEKFKVFIGTYDSDPFILDTLEDYDKAFAIDPMKIYEIPIEHKIEFNNSIYAGIQDVLGKPTVSSKTFIKDKKEVEECLSLTKLYDKDYMFVSDEIEDKIINHMDKKRISVFSSNKMYNPEGEGENFKRVIALDIGVTRDRFGFAMLHRRSEIKVNRQRENLSGTFEDFVYWADICIAFLPSVKGKKLRLEKIRDFIRDLRDLGFDIALVTADGYQSLDTLQILEKDGFKVKDYSVDKKKNAYYALKYAIEEKRIKLPKNEILREELFCLVETDKKIDHLEGIRSNIEVLKNRELDISKDLTDAVASAIFNFNDIPVSKFDNKEFVQKLKMSAGLTSGNSTYDALMRMGGKSVDMFDRN